MGKQSIWQLLGLGIVIVVLLFALTSVIEKNPRKAQVQEQHSNTLISESVTLTIEGLYDGKEITISQGETVLGVLQDLDTEDPALRLETKDYGSMGTLVEGINGITNGTDNKYWQYEVNGEMPQIGADAFTLSSGDTVLWYFDTSEF